MAQTVEIGTLFIRDGAVLPKSLRVDSEPYLKGWRLVRNPLSAGMNRQLFEAGWTFFYMAGEVDATVVGSDLEKTTRRAVKKLIPCMKSGRLNCLEIAQVTVKRFLGLPCVTVSAHPRHIQESMFLFHSKRLAEWDRAQTGCRRLGIASQRRELCRKEMVTKPGLAENAGARFSGGSALKNCERRREQNNPARPLPGRREDNPTSGH